MVTAHIPSPRRLPIPKDPPAADRDRSAAAVIIVVVVGSRLGRLAVLDDVARLKQHSLGDLAPLRRAPQEELEVHAEVLVLLADRIGHHGSRFRILLDRQPLLVPADRLGLLGQRRAQPCERARLLR